MEDTNKADNRIYELGYIMLPLIEEKNLAEEVGNLKAMIDGLGAQSISEEFPRLIELAYEMTKVIENKNNHFNTGYFGWMKFELDPSMIGELEAKLKHNEKFVRFLLIKTVRENTMSPKKSFSRVSEMKKRNMTKPEGEVAPVINKEEIDKQIDALVSDEVVAEKEESII